jgi:hypothetical protein
MPEHNHTINTVLSATLTTTAGKPEIKVHMTFSGDHSKHRREQLERLFNEFIRTSAGYGFNIQFLAASMNDFGDPLERLHAANFSRKVATSPGRRKSRAK